MGEFHGSAYEGLILDKIAFYVEIVVALEPLRLKVFRHQVQGGAEIDGEGALGVAAAHEYHGASAGVRAFQEHGLDSVLLLVALEQESELVVSYLPDETGRHAENRGAGDCVGGRTAGHILHPERLERCPDLVSGLHVNMLHAAFRKMVVVEERVILQNCQDVGEGVPYSKYRFHILQN